MKSCRALLTQGGYRVPYSSGILRNSENVCKPRMILDSWTKFSLGRGLESSSRRLLVPEQGRVLSFDIDFFPASSPPLLRRQRAEKFYSSVAPLNLLARFPCSPLNFNYILMLPFHIKKFISKPFYFLEMSSDIFLHRIPHISPFIKLLSNDSLRTLSLF